MKFGLIILAAGKGARFGASKLEVELCGKPIVEYILSNIDKSLFHRIAIVASNENIMHIAERYSILGIINSHPEKSISESIKLGTQKVKESDAYVYCVSDQPLLSKKTIGVMLKAYKKDTILALSHNGRRGNPVIFPNYLYDELVNLKTGESGQVVINNHLDILRHFETTDASQLLDIDTKENYKKIEQIICKKYL